jgi:hypothetical protein
MFSKRAVLCTTLAGWRRLFMYSKFIYSGKPNHMKKKIVSYFLFFRTEFQLDSDEEANLKELCIFFALIYVQSWLEAPNAVDAAINDLNLVQKLETFKSINPIISKRALEKISHHLWYLSPEMVPLSLFSDKA